MPGNAAGPYFIRGPSVEALFRKNRATTGPKETP